MLLTTLALPLFTLGSAWPAALGNATLHTVCVLNDSAPVLAGARDAVPAQLGFATVGLVA